MTRWLLGALWIGLVACVAEVDGAAPSGIETASAEAMECTCVPTTTQVTTCEPRAVCTGSDACAGVESREARAHAELAHSFEGFYFQGLIATGQDFSAAVLDCSGSSDELLPETLQVEPYAVDGCHCAVSIDCTRVRTTALGCAHP
jgi:hypothetical protein